MEDKKLKDFGIEKPKFKSNNELKQLLEDTALNTDVKVKGEKAILKSEEHKKVESEIEDWKNKKIDYKISQEFNLPNELLNCLISTSQYNGLIFEGEGGIGKTILTMASIKSKVKSENWAYSNGYTTPLSLYEFLYLNRDKQLIILDDIEGVFNNKLSLAILKGALWEVEGKRICQYSSKSDKAEFPEKFIMKAKIIILCNQIPKENDSSTRAMISRTIFYKMRFTFQEKLKICKRFVSEDENLNAEEKMFINDLLNKNVNEATKDFNFRTLKKLIAFVKYDKEKAEELFKATTEIDELKSAYLRIARKVKLVKLQLQLFMEETGKSRATFFRIKKEIVSKYH